MPRQPSHSLSYMYEESEGWNTPAPNSGFICLTGFTNLPLLTSYPSVHGPLDWLSRGMARGLTHWRILAQRYLCPQSLQPILTLASILVSEYCSPLCSQFEPLITMFCSWTVMTWIVVIGSSLVMIAWIIIYSFFESSDFNDEVTVLFGNVTFWATVVVSVVVSLCKCLAL